ncbi:protein containing ankyrin repeat [Sulfurimonas gotlandica GD1]|uniref:Protein containing ankyrin repeat n=1 Tax=Sulfurimonas gotlandica (strain DSM 19862 / JCM 16533 / GD1) TaxID=929558 RepID=B6BJB7_SULGG|nr:ankyrin repeat domain-containing protein [Sulfurimonas gotlandica]EDZ63777.1 ankyrin repeat protein [Sulfurimonas gotlandica GD1]EHP30638.1 protein containing ankyrin repeat [Sulfurimonas gotlandica GD1]
MKKLVNGFYKERSLLVICSLFIATTIFFSISFDAYLLNYENTLLALLLLNTYFAIRLAIEVRNSKNSYLQAFIPFMMGFVAIVYVIYELSNITLTLDLTKLSVVILLIIGEVVASALSINAEYTVYRRSNEESSRNYLPKIPFAVESAFKYIPISLGILFITTLVCIFIIADPIKSFWYIIIFLPISIHLLALGDYFIFVDKQRIASTLKELDEQDKNHLLATIGMKLANKKSTSCRKTTTEQYQTVKHFLENGMDPNEIFENRYTLLLPSSCCGDYKLVRMLLDYGANINFQSKVGSTALILASKHNSKELVQLLIENGADVNIKDPQGKTALDYAKEGHFEEVVKILTCE